MSSRRDLITPSQSELKVFNTKQVRLFLGGDIVFQAP